MQIFVKVPTNKFHENPSIGSLADRRTDITKIVGAFRYVGERD
jgi:hypothetical protein